MRARPSILLASLLSLAATAVGQEAGKSIEASGFVVGVDTYFDFGPPLNYYEIFIVIPTQEGAKVEKFTLTPLAHKCYAPEKTEYVEKTTTLTVKELLAGEDPCAIREKDLKKEQTQKKHELNFSGANISLQVSRGGATRTIKTEVLERDWFLAHPGTPKDTGWTMELLNKLGSLTGPGVREKPAFAMTETGPVAPLSADPATLQDLAAGKYDSLFPNPEEKASDIYRGSLVPLPQPSVTLLSSTPMEPAHFTLPAYPRLPWLVQHEGEPSVALRIDSQGNVSAVEMYMGSKLFEGAVRDAVKDWKFPPAPPSTEMLDPPREVTVRFSFQLNCKANEEKK
jgi:TonB family protein